jgi:hypothetical protein
MTTLAISESTETHSCAWAVDSEVDSQPDSRFGDVLVLVLVVLVVENLNSSTQDLEYGTGVPGRGAVRVLVLVKFQAHLVARVRVSCEGPAGGYAT